MLSSCSSSPTATDSRHAAREAVERVAVAERAGDHVARVQRDHAPVHVLERVVGRLRVEHACRRSPCRPRPGSRRRAPRCASRSRRSVTEAILSSVQRFIAAPPCAALLGATRASPARRCRRAGLGRAARASPSAPRGSAPAAPRARRSGVARGHQAEGRLDALDETRAAARAHARAPADARLRRGEEAPRCRAGTDRGTGPGAGAGRRRRRGGPSRSAGPRSARASRARGARASSTSAAGASKAMRPLMPSTVSPRW